MKFIHESDIQIREWVKNNILNNASAVTFYEDRFSKFDAEYITKNGDKRFVEIKNRHFNHNQYTTTDIEKDKYFEMMDNNNCDLCICFNDGVLYYSPKDLQKNLLKFTSHNAPDQYDALNNRWDVHKKQFACFSIDENRFIPYTKFSSSPTREIIPSEYNN